jgi:hypothetical protein
MRCQCCNEILTSYEATLRHAVTKKFVELCGVCLKEIGSSIPLQVRNDLIGEADTDLVDLLDTDEDEGLYIDEGDYDDYWRER